jgi:tetratricopeptide (TPR) repeat protein
LGTLNRAKVVAAAHKHLAKGNLRKAVREYDRVLKEDPSDIRTKLKVADLLYRLGEKDHATQTFEEVARFYASQGFLLKAVAVYKQVQKLKPHDHEIYLALASLYQQIGLVNEAVIQFREAIAIQEKIGLTLDRLRTAQRMLELDPDNARLRVALAEEFSREGMIEEAVHEFRIATDILKRLNRTDEFIRVAERLLYHQPDDFDVSRDVAAYYIARQDGLKALSRLQMCYRARPADPEVLELLARVFEFMGQPQKAVTVLKSLAASYDRTGLLRDRDEVFRRVLKLSPGDASAARALRFTPPVTVESGIELEFEASPPSKPGRNSRPSTPAPVREEPEEEIDVEEEGDDPTNPDVEKIRLGQRPVFPQRAPKESSEPSAEIGIDDLEGGATLVQPMRLPAPPPSSTGIDFRLVPEEFQDDIQNLEFLVDAGLHDEALELLQDIRRRAGDLSILARYETLIRGR